MFKLGLKVKRYMLAILKAIHKTGVFIMCTDR